MIERIRIQNYKCLRDVTVDLDPFTVLIGPNDSGKSSFLEGVALLGDLVRRPINEVFHLDRSFENLIWKKDADLRLVLTVEGSFDAKRYQYELAVSNPVRNFSPFEKLVFDGRTAFENDLGNSKVHVIGSRSIQSGPMRTLVSNFQPVLSWNKQDPHYRFAIQLAQYERISLDPAKMTRPSAPVQDARLESDGSNIAGYLDTLFTGSDASIRLSIESELTEMFPALKGISLSTPTPGQKALGFTLATTNGRAVTVPAALVSTGAILYTGYLAIAHSSPATTLLVEEPENGVHPHLLGQIVKLLRKFTSTEVDGVTRQVILTTHSPILLNEAKPEEIRVFRREDDRSTSVRKFTDIPNHEEMLKGFTPGELWYLLGEKRMFEGAEL